MKMAGSKISKDSSSQGAALVGMGILCSKASGFVRDVVMAYFFGASGLADVWRVSLKIPNVIQNLLGEGSLSASVIPIYAELAEKEQKQRAGHFIGAILGILLVAGALASLVGVIFVPMLLPSIFVAWDAEKVSLVGTLIKILFPMTGLLVISAWTLAILNSHKRFFLPYCAPVAWNGAIVSFVTGMAWFRGVTGEQLLVIAAWGALVGASLQIIIQVPSVVKCLEGFHLSMGRSVFGVREALKNFVPVATARGVVNISSLLEVVLAALLAEGAVAALGYAQTLYFLPISIFGLSVAAAELPELSRQRLIAPDLLMSKVGDALERTYFWVVPSAVSFVFLGGMIISGIYERGEFSQTDVPVVAAILAAYALGLISTSGSRVLSTGFYSVRDTRTPAKIAYLRVVLSLSVGALLMFPFDRFQSGDLHYGPVGLALGASLAAWVEYGMLKNHLKRILESRILEVKGKGRMFFASFLAVFLSYMAQPPIQIGMGKLKTNYGIISSIEHSVSAVLVMLIFGLSYLFIMDCLGVGWSISEWIKNLRRQSELNDSE